MFYLISNILLYIYSISFFIQIKILVTVSNSIVHWANNNGPFQLYYLIMKIQPKLCALLLVVFVFGPIKISSKINLMSSHN